MSRSRFDLEQDILSFGHCVEDLKFITKNLDDLQEPLDVRDKEELSFTLKAIAKLIDLKIERTFDTFTQVLALDKYKESVKNSPF